MDLSLLLGFQC